MAIKTIKEIRIKYNQSKKGKETRKRYMQSKKGKIARAKANEKYQRTIKGKKAQNIYRQTEKGKFAHCRQSSKRRKNLDFIPLFDNPFDKLENIQWHHIDDVHIVAIPKDLHRQYLGIHHREKIMTIVEQIYGGG